MVATASGRSYSRSYWVRVSSWGCAAGATSIQVVSSHAGLPLPSDLLDRWRSGHAPAVWAWAHFFEGGRLGPTNPSSWTRLPGGRRWSWLAIKRPMARQAACRDKKGMEG